MDKKSDANNTLSSWYNGINPEARQALLRGLIGAGAGAAIGGGMSFRSRDPDATVAAPAVLGALLGGTAAAGLPAGLRMMNGGITFNQKTHKPMVGRLGDSAVGTVVRHPAMTGLGLWTATRPRAVEVWGQLYDTMRKQPAEHKTMNATERLKEALKTMTGRAQQSNAFASGTEKARVAIEAAATEGGYRAAGNIHPRRLAMLPLALAGGWMADKYIRGEY